MVKRRGASVSAKGVRSDLSLTEEDFGVMTDMQGAARKTFVKRERSASLPSNEIEFLPVGLLR